MRKIAYKRCSTNEDKQDVGRQLHGMIFDEVVVEYASGKNEKGRPLFKKCLKELQEGDELHFQDLSRAGRNSIELQVTIKDLLKRGITVIFHSEGLRFSGDGKNPMSLANSELLLSMLSAVNQLFLTQNSIAIKQGLQAAKAKGVKLGAASPKYNKTNHVSRGINKEVEAHLDKNEDSIRHMLNLIKTGVVKNEKGKKPRSMADLVKTVNLIKTASPHKGDYWTNKSLQRAMTYYNIQITEII